MLVLFDTAAGLAIFKVRLNEINLELQGQQRADFPDC